MTIASDIISHKMPDFEAYLQLGESLDDIDEYGFTPLIECAITRQLKIAKQLIKYKIDVNKSDVTGRTPLHWAVDNNDFDFAHLLLSNGANPNAYTRNGLSILVYPLLRGQDKLKHLLYQNGAKLDFALDFINGKLLGHRFELQGDVDIVTANNEFIELDYEGFILEFTVSILKDSLKRFINSYSTRHLREYFPLANVIIDAFNLAEELLHYQHLPFLGQEQISRLRDLGTAPMLILPAASRGHAMGFIRYGQWWAKIDRGENSLKEGSVNIYKISNIDDFNDKFLQNFLYKKQERRYFHQVINRQLGLIPVAKMPISSQISGNCSWANIQAIVPVAYAIQELEKNNFFDTRAAVAFYNEWVEWDKERAIDECIQRFYLAKPMRKASLAAMLGGVLFQTCNYQNKRHLELADKILKVLTIPEYEYVLKSYLEEYCIKRLTKKGNNLLKILDDCGINPNIGVNPFATGL